MAQNRPIAAAGARTPQLGKVPLEQGPEIFAPPCHAVFFGGGEERSGQASAAPQAVPGAGDTGGRRLPNREPAEQHALRAARQALRGLSQEAAGGAAQDEEPCRPVVSVHQHPEHQEQVRPELDFVDHHDPAERREGPHGFIETREARWGLEIEVVDGFRFDETSGEGGLAALARPGKHYDRGAAEGRSDRFEGRAAFQHRRILP